MSDLIESFCRSEFGSRSSASATIGLVARSSPKLEEFGSNSPARRVSRWRAPATSGGLDRAASPFIAAFLADLVAIEETEPFQSDRILL